MVHWLVEKNKNLFLETRNPLYAWKAFEHAWRLGYPVPDEIMEYIWGAAHELSKIAYRPPKAAQRPYAIAKAFKLHKNGAGQGSSFTEYSKRNKDREIALCAAKKIDEWGDGKDDYAYAEVAKKYGKGFSKSKVRRIHLVYLERWNQMIQQLIESGQVRLEDDGRVFLHHFRVEGTADDLREAAEILKEIERKQRK